MKKLLSLVLTVFALCGVLTLTAPKAEAARLALVPLEQSEQVLVENNIDLGILYWDVANEVFKFPAFDMVSDAAMEKALPEGFLKTWDQAELERIAKETEADVVVAMRLDKLVEKEDYFRREAMTKTRVVGEYISLNRVTGKFLHKKLNEQRQFETAILVRSDWRIQECTKLMKRYMGRTRDNE